MSEVKPANSSLLDNHSSDLAKNDLMAAFIDIGSTQPSTTVPQTTADPTVTGAGTPRKGSRRSVVRAENQAPQQDVSDVKLSGILSTQNENSLKTELIKPFEVQEEPDEKTQEEMTLDDLHLANSFPLLQNHRGTIVTGSVVTTPQEMSNSRHAFWNLCKGFVGAGKV
ncbi:hypothetical protein RFI_15089 [Reticulomyxa filosa]|uniref:Uncharacterized protein n=1 Tax=Reticulomyxa filosa TaxID=46433 RepID=X6N8N2_RETFI|nr:hypothetical protein RFI_15089 [Reticulomyxa filosa]|eukprot:ETO22114.1 hypothetical protein RFI_15089 [Reticulomyxa filosa]